MFKNAKCKIKKFCCCVIFLINFVDPLSVYQVIVDPSYNHELLVTDLHNIIYTHQ